MFTELLVSAFLLAGAFFALVGSIGLARLDDFYSRLHGPTKATTLGVGGMLAASAIYFSTRGGGVSLHELLVSIFLFMTAPVSAHLLARAALHLRVPSISADPEHALGDDPGSSVPSGSDTVVAPTTPAPNAPPFSLVQPRSTSPRQE